MRTLAGLTFFLTAALLMPSCESYSPVSRTIHEEHSLYQFIRVEEDLFSGERLLYTSAGRNIKQGGIRVKDPDELLFEYNRLAFSSLAFLEEDPSRVLFVGLGAGTMPRFFAGHYPDAVVDIVELDPAMLTIARDYFHFAEGERIKVHLMDGRTFIKKTKARHDMIFLDAYRGEQIPFHLTTVQFLREVKDCLNEGGVVVSNILSEANNRYFWSMVKTYRQEFGSLFIFKGEWSGNHIFVAMADKIPFDQDIFLERARSIQTGKGIEFDLARALWSYDNEKHLGNARILTDDFAPVNLLRQHEVQD
ncbi:MAG: fused MFS/spermidine synthase [Proteobacteria bacterium]|nr:fused MFS/spermidine synthase [Pseudomonadota bacterium]